jgi:hypothetical protein
MEQSCRELLASKPRIGAMFKSRQAHVDEKSPALLPEHAGAIYKIEPFVTEVSAKARG